MGYSQRRGRKPFERASKIAHAEVINNPLVQEFVAHCTLPKAPTSDDLATMLQLVPKCTGRISTVIAIDGGMTETYIREELPSAAVAFVTLGPILLRVEDLAELDSQVFIGPEDMAKLRSVQRYSLVVPTRTIRARGAGGFAHGVRKTIQEFLLSKDHLMHALQWLLFREWRKPAERESWEIPCCPNPSCSAANIAFTSGGPTEQPCASCGEPVFLSDALRLYERIDEEQGAGGILSYLLTALEQIVLVHLIRSVWDMKPEILREVLFIKDGPLAFFGVTAPLYAPMRELMAFLGTGKGAPVINLVGVEKSGPFVEHAALIERFFRDDHVLVLDNAYIYKHIVPGDAAGKQFGSNTYYGSKVIYRGSHQDTYVATIPTRSYNTKPSLGDLYNLPDVLRTLSKLRCSMYDNALVPIVLANRLVSLADVPSSEILKKFAKQTIHPG